jgi:hypothetical protein
MCPAWRPGQRTPPCSGVLRLGGGAGERGGRGPGRGGRGGVVVHPRGQARADVQRRSCRARASGSATPALWARVVNRVRTQPGSASAACSTAPPGGASALAITNAHPVNAGSVNCSPWASKTPSSRSRGRGSASVPGWSAHWCRRGGPRDRRGPALPCCRGCRRGMPWRLPVSTTSAVSPAAAPGRGPNGIGRRARPPGTIRELSSRRPPRVHARLHRPGCAGSRAGGLVSSS